jgi:hypothetical protein
MVLAQTFFPEGSRPNSGQQPANISLVKINEILYRAVKGNGTNVLQVDATITATIAGMGVSNAFGTTLSTSTNVSAILAGVSAPIPVIQTNAPGIKMTFGGFVKVFTGDTNVPVQLTNATTLVRFVTVAGYSNYLANAQTAWLSVSGSGGPFYPIVSGGERNIGAPANMAFDLTNAWARAQATNDSFNITFGQ